MIRLFVVSISPHHKIDPRPALVAEALGMDQPGWPADPATHLAMAQSLLRDNPTAFALLMSLVDQFHLGGEPAQGRRSIIPYVRPYKCLRPEISM